MGWLSASATTARRGLNLQSSHPASRPLIRVLSSWSGQQGQSCSHSGNATTPADDGLLVVPAPAVLTCSSAVSRVEARRGDLPFVLGRRGPIGGRCRARSEGVSMGGVGGDSMLVDADRVEGVLPGAGVMTKHHLVRRGFLRRRTPLRVLVLIVGLVVLLLGRSPTGPCGRRRDMRARSRGCFPRPLRLFGWLGVEEIHRATATCSCCRRNPGDQHETGGQERYQTSSHVPSPSGGDGQ
jgi:hypothetical protein